MMLKRQQHDKTGFANHSVLGLGYYGFHRMRYLTWGDEKAEKTLVCVHGVSRNARDFDSLAADLCDEYRVVCPDIVGRGDSDRLIDPEHYNYLQYNTDMNTLIARLNVTSLDWIGTSMGGIIGMVLASQPQTPIRKLVLNDIGPIVPHDALVGVGQYIGRAPRFDNMKEGEAYLREVHAAFGPFTDEDWKHMAEHSLRMTSDGKYTLKADPRIGETFRKSIPYSDVDMWHIWDQIECPVLVLRGEKSNFLTAAIAEQMRSRGPGAEIVEIPDVGHTPGLRNAEQIRLIREWLADPDPND